MSLSRFWQGSVPFCISELTARHDDAQAMLALGKTALARGLPMERYAGRGRVREWVAKHGDPRNPKVDTVDWVERISLAETRNYVQRVMENLQVYAARLGASVSTVEPNLHRVTAIESSAKPTFVNAIHK
jgi:hypothetical protein